MLYQSKAQFLEKVAELKKEYLLLGIDIGASGLGMAIFSSGPKLSMPYKIINNNQLEQEVSYLRPQGIVIGANKNIEKNFFKKVIKLIDKTALPYIFQDESYSTIIANELLKEVGLNRKKRNNVDDKLSAKLILDWFCDIR